MDPHTDQIGRSVRVPGRIGGLNEYRTTLSGAARTGRYRSWQDRFGARLLEVDFVDIRLLVSRAAADTGGRTAIAAEHFAFSDDAHKGRRRIGDIAPWRTIRSGTSGGTDANAQRRKSCCSYRVAGLLR